MNRALVFCLALTSLLPCPARPQSSTPPYWSDSWRGWHFYEDPEPDPPQRPTEPVRPSPSIPKPPQTKPSEIIEFERLQRQLDEARQVAIMRPSVANVRRYMQLEADVVARASAFADMAQRIAWSTPELDPSLQGRPVNARAIEVFDQVQTTQRGDAVAALARDHVLLFFYRSDCPYCHAVAPTLQAFEAQHAIRVVAISVDGGQIAGFADTRRDNGIANALRVSQVPAVYLAQPFTGRITPIGFGVLSEAQLLERIAVVAAAGADVSPLTERTQASLR